MKFQVSYVFAQNLNNVNLNQVFDSSLRTRCGVKEKRRTTSQLRATSEKLATG